MKVHLYDINIVHYEKSGHTMYQVLVDISTYASASAKHAKWACAD